MLRSRGGSMPYWSIYCFHCRGYIIDALPECVPVSRRSSPAFPLLAKAHPGAALACPYCNALCGPGQLQPLVRRLLGLLALMAEVI